MHVHAAMHSLPRCLSLAAGQWLLVATAVLGASEELPEEIVVEGERDRINLQLLVDEAENAFYTLFNELVDDADFRIECKYETVLGTRVKSRICQTRYMREELTTAAMFNYFGMEYQASAALTAKNRELRRKTIELLENNPELRSAAQNLSRRVEEYQDEYGIDADSE